MGALFEEYFHLVLTAFLKTWNWEEKQIIEIKKKGRELEKRKLMHGWFEMIVEMCIQEERIKMN